MARDPVLGTQRSERFEEIPKDIVIPAKLNAVDQGRYATKSPFANKHSGRNTKAGLANYGQSVVATIQRAIDENRLTVTSTAADGGSKGNYATFAALNLAVPIPVEGDSATVDDSAGMTGGSAGVPAVVSYNSGAWAVSQLIAGSVATMTGATTAAAGTSGSVPAPPQDSQNKPLFGDGTFKETHPDWSAIDYEVGDIFVDPADNSIYRVNTAIASGSNVNVAAAIAVSDNIGADTSVTTGTLPSATAPRTVPMNNQNLTIDEVNDYAVNAQTYTKGDGAGANLPATDSDAVATVSTVRTADGRELQREIQSLIPISSTAAPVDGTDKAWFVGQFWQVVDGSGVVTALYRAKTKSTDPDAAATGSEWTEINLGSSLQQYTSGDAEIWATGTGITFTKAPNGEFTFAIPAGVDIIKANIAYALGDVDTANSNKAYILFDYAGARSFNTSLENANFPDVTVYPDDAAPSRVSPLNGKDDITHGISAIAGGDGSDLEITVTSSAQGIQNQMVIDFAH